MRRFIPIALVALVAGGVFARSAMQSPEPEAGEKKIVDLKSDLSGPIAPGDSVIFLVGNFAAQHNGAVITCDSAVRYSEKRLEFFGNVLINKNTTYIYGDRADYDRDLNQARVYSDIIKVVDGDATLYTYEFVFNTRTNVGEFARGGVLINRDSRLESVRGFYYGDTKELISVDEVEMRNDEYELKGDSVVYNMATDNAYFFDRTNIWNRDGDYLYADRGEYRKADTLYIVTRNGYILTQKQEMWSDSIDFYRAEDHVILRRDLQLDDTEHKVIAFGDYGEYWKTPGNAFLTRDPAVVSYDLSQGDSLFMRSDSMFLYTIFRADEEAAAARRDSLARVAADSLAAVARGDEVAPGIEPATDARVADAPDSVARTTGAKAPAAVDSLAAAPADSLARTAPADSLAGADTVQLTPQERKAQLREAAAKAKAERKAAAAEAKKQKLAEIAAKRKAKNAAKLDAQKARDEKRLQARRLKEESKMRARRLRAARKGKKYELIDPAVVARLDSLLARNLSEQDSLLQATYDSLLLAQILPADTTDSAAMPDSMYRIVKGYRNVRIYRSDFQSVCDSMTAISTDSTIHLYIDPVLWNENNQITSDVMDIFTERQQIVRAEFIGSPMMVSQLDTVHYNQVAGKTMTAFFRDNQIYRNDVNGNAQTIYYMQDGEPPVITMMGVIESGNISFFIEDKQVVQIVYRGNPVYNFYPMDKIPPTQELYLRGFKWEGARRPTQREVFDRTIRPSERRMRERLRHPEFPIMHRIEEHKLRLQEERRWTDRNEQVDQATVEWMHELGFEVGQPRESGPVL
ncbi:OstA-like protein [Alistipes sp.]|uniref:OstA-like protein n=1 Tax=Alistipes sp. TaxID=1872444 RepID=UPI003AF10B8A